MRVIFDHVRPSGRIMPVMQVIEAQSAWSWGLTITSITSMSGLADRPARHAPGRGSPTSSQPYRSADHAPPHPVADRSNQKTQSPTRGMRSGRRAGGSQRAQTLRHADRHEATDTDCRPGAKSSITHSRKAVGMAGFEPAASCSQSRRANQAALHPAEPTVAYRSSGFRAHCRPVRVGGSAAVVGGGGTPCEEPVRYA